MLKTLLGYGKGPAVRYIVIGIMALLGSHGVTNAAASDWANATWEILSSAAVSLVAWYLAAKSREALHAAPPPEVRSNA